MTVADRIRQGTASVLLGFEVGSGDPVDIPIAHMVVCGQTQLSGKTTTMEALIARSGARALAFKTKRGERAFTVGLEQVDGRIYATAPYFRERADWQFVSAILEAHLGERMKFERSWIMRAARGARTLADVLRNVDKLGAKATGMSADMFMMLGEYLREVIPQLARLPISDGVKLRPGINVVDLTDFSVQVQGLVIASMLAWVHEREGGVITLLPESWKFIPQGRNSPVRMAAIALAREGAGIGNLLWIDSQDLAGAEKEVVRQCSVYVLGVQREMNEVKRTLDHIPAGFKKPKAADVATLGRGEFFACYGDRVVRVYVCPAWLPRPIAVGIARGEIPPSRAGEYFTPRPIPLQRLAGFDIDPALIEDPKPEIRAKIKSESARMAMAAETTLLEHLATQHDEPLPAFHDRQPKEDDDMTKAQEEKLDTLITLLMLQAQEHTEAPAAPGKPRPRPRDSDQLGVPDTDVIVDAVISRLKDRAPALLKVLMTKARMEIDVRVETIQVDGKSLRGRLARMMAAGFFDTWASGTSAHKELQQSGFSTAPPNVYRELDTLCEMGFLRKQERVGYMLVEGMRENIVTGSRR